MTTVTCMTCKNIMALGHAGGAACCYCGGTTFMAVQCVPQDISSLAALVAAWPKDDEADEPILVEVPGGDR